MYFYIASVEANFERDGAIRRRTMNIVLELQERKITAAALNNAQLAITQRLFEEMGVDRESTKDLVFLNISYLGHMPRRAFHDMQPESLDS